MNCTMMDGSKNIKPPGETDIFSDSKESIQILNTGARIHYCVHPASSPHLERNESSLSLLILFH
jgi:hypothetical protein